MITGIPKKSDYDSTARALLNLAWQISIDLSIFLKEAKENSGAQRIERKYWRACQPQLTTALSLTQQASELFLKARIISKSPYLLISTEPKNWSKVCDNTRVPFSEFRTIDAQDLIYVHDAVGLPCLSPDTKKCFNDLRKKRNTIMHAVDKHLKLDLHQIIIAILEYSDCFVGPSKWIECRRQHIESSPNAIAYRNFPDATTFCLAREFECVIEALAPAEIKDFFRFDKKQRRYTCPHCTSDCRDAEYKPRFALLQPKGSNSTTLHCYLCENDFSVIRKPCAKRRCKGNVIFKDELGDETCLTCD